MAFSIRYERTGSLFQKPFKRRLVDSDRYFAVLVRYIHRNPQKHGLISDFRAWPWSSYDAILEEGSEMPTFQKLASLASLAQKPTFQKLASVSVACADVLAWFGGRAPFIALHEVDPDERTIADYIIE